MYNTPFYFAIADYTPTAVREKVPSLIKSKFGVSGKIEFHSRDNDSHCYIYKVV